MQRKDQITTAAHLAGYIMQSRPENRVSVAEEYDHLVKDGYDIAHVIKQFNSNFGAGLAYAQARQERIQEAFALASVLACFKRSTLNILPFAIANECVVRTGDDLLAVNRELYGAARAEFTLRHLDYVNTPDHLVSIVAQLTGTRDTQIRIAREKGSLVHSAAILARIIGQLSPANQLAYAKDFAHLIKSGDELACVAVALTNEGERFNFAMEMRHVISLTEGIDNIAASLYDEHASTFRAHTTRRELGKYEREIKSNGLARVLYGNRSTLFGKSVGDNETMPSPDVAIDLNMRQ